MNPGQHHSFQSASRHTTGLGFLSRLLQSVECQQDSLPYELRVQDNGSVDDTAAVFARMACSDPRWFYERNERELGRTCEHSALHDAGSRKILFGS